MIDERETKNMELMSFAAKMAVDAVISANRKAYFNTSVGAFMRNISFAFQAMISDVKSEKEDRNPEFVWSRVKAIKEQVEGAPDGCYENERDVLYLVDGVSLVYREYIAKRDDIDLEIECSRSFSR